MFLFEPTSPDDLIRETFSADCHLETLTTEVLVLVLNQTKQVLAVWDVFLHCPIRFSDSFILGSKQILPVRSLPNI